MNKFKINPEKFLKKFNLCFTTRDEIINIFETVINELIAFNNIFNRETYDESISCYTFIAERLKLDPILVELVIILLDNKKYSVISNGLFAIRGVWVRMVWIDEDGIEKLKKLGKFYE